MVTHLERHNSARTRRRRMPQQSTEPLEALDRAFLSLPAEAAVPNQARARARQWAQTALAIRADTPDLPVALAYAVEMLSSLPTAAALHHRELRDLIDTICEQTGTPRLALGRLLFANPLQDDDVGQRLAPEPALSRALALALAVIGAETISLWQARRGTPVQVAFIGGPPEPTLDTIAAATELFSTDGPGESFVDSTVGVRLIEPGAQVALICTGAWATPLERPLLLSTAGRVIGPIWTRLAAGERRMSAGAAERQLTRLRFDLHDGPLQDVVLLAEDLRLFGSQLESALSEHPQRRRVIGRLEDLTAMLVALDGDLRRIASLLESPFLRSHSFSEGLSQIVGAFSQRTEIIPDVQLSDGLDDLTDSQHITLLGLIREALSNIREHSDAGTVAITVTAERTGVTATVRDDGQGFEPESALVKAARAGHLGLVGMHERVRMLGGVTRIDSRPGGPTTISVSLPPTTTDDGLRRC